MGYNRARRASEDVETAVKRFSLSKGSAVPLCKVSITPGSASLCQSTGLRLLYATSSLIVSGIPQKNIRLALSCFSNSLSGPLPVLHGSNDLHRLKRVDLKDIEVFGHRLWAIIGLPARRLVAWILVVKGRLLVRFYWEIWKRTAGDCH